MLPSVYLSKMICPTSPTFLFSYPFIHIRYLLCLTFLILLVMVTIHCKFITRMKWESLAKNVPCGLFHIRRENCIWVYACQSFTTLKIWLWCLCRTVRRIHYVALSNLEVWFEGMDDESSNHSYMACCALLSPGRLAKWNNFPKFPIINNSLVIEVTCGWYTAMKQFFGLQDYLSHPVNGARDHCHNCSLLIAAWQSS